MSLEWLHTIRHRDYTPCISLNPLITVTREVIVPVLPSPKKQGPPFPSCGIFKKSEAFGV